MLVSWNLKRKTEQVNKLFTAHFVKFIRASRASLRSIKQKLQTSTVAAETVSNFTDELLIVAMDKLAMNVG